MTYQKLKKDYCTQYNIRATVSAALLTDCNKSRNYTKERDKIYTNWNILCAGIAQSVQRLATGWTVREKNPVGARFSRLAAGPTQPPVICTGSFPGVNRPRRGVDHPPPSSAGMKKGAQLYIYSPSGPSCPVLGWTLPLQKYIYIIIQHFQCHGDEFFVLNTPQWIQLRN